MNTILIFHQQNQLSPTYNFGGLDLVVIFQTCNNRLNLILEMAWEITQNYLYQHDQVWIAYRENSRPSYIGDLIQLEDGRLFLMTRDGFEPVYLPPLVHVALTIKHDEAYDNEEFCPSLDCWGSSDEPIFFKGCGDGHYLETYRRFRKQQLYRVLRQYR